MGQSLWRSILKTIKSTHKHPANIALHCIGLVMYGVFLADFASSIFSGASIQPIPNLVLIGCAIPMFLTGHLIEGNFRYITPVLIARLVLRYFRKRRRNLAANRLH